MFRMWMIIRFSQNVSLFKTSRSRVVFVKNKIYYLKIYLLTVLGTQVWYLSMCQKKHEVVILF